MSGIDSAWDNDKVAKDFWEDQTINYVQVVDATWIGNSTTTVYPEDGNTVIYDPPKMVEEEPDMVNHPPHYNMGGIECIDAIESALTGLTGAEAYYTGNIIKYIWRWKYKNGVEDLKKIEFYLNRLIKYVEKKGT